MKLSELYLPYEEKVIDHFFDKVIQIIRDKKDIPCLHNIGEPREGEYLEVNRISGPTETIYFNR
ncbi:MAG TPA: hypothetical protein VFF33_13430 [Ignavibacteriaceae bacterium]|nr:hypothetical protein [Ignavibacteriaceae bacterium]